MILCVKFLPQMQNLSLIRKKHQTKMKKVGVGIHNTKKSSVIFKCVNIIKIEKRLRCYSRNLRDTIAKYNA